MRIALFVASCLAALVTAVGCASILSIPERSLEWCDRPENKHDFCEDFDHRDAGAAWGPGVMGAASYAFVASDDTPPNALKMSTEPQPSGSPAVAGFFQEFPDRKFDHVRINLDVRFASIDLAAQDGLASQLGFLLLEEPNFCLGVVLTPSGIATVMRAHTRDCTSVDNVPDDAGPTTDDAGLTAYAPVAPLPGTNHWYHVRLDVTRNADGSGAVKFDMNYPGVISAPQIPAGFLTDAPPAVAIATSVRGPSGRVELHFDNVTVDFPPN
jgi:hypothetical protein